MKITCPCCAGKGEIDDVPPVPLTPMQLKIFNAVKRSPHGVGGDRLVDVIYADRVDGGPEYARVSLSVLIINANARLKAAGVEITTRVNGRRSLFYRLVAL